MQHIITTSVASLHLEDGVAHFQMLDPNPSLESYQQHFRDSKPLFEAGILPLPAMVYTAGGKIGYTKEVRDFMSTAEFGEYVTAMAIIVDSVIARVAANLFLKVSHVVYPTQLFTDKEKALTWLQQYKRK